MFEGLHGVITPTCMKHTEIHLELNTHSHAEATETPKFILSAIKDTFCTGQCDCYMLSKRTMHRQLRSYNYMIHSLFVPNIVRQLYELGRVC